MTRPLLLLAAVALAACTDVPTGPDRSNPYDPSFNGSRQISQPGRPSLSSSTDASLTLTWADSSSFEAGYRIERAVPAAPPSDPAFESVAVVGPGVTTYAESAAANVEGFLYRVVGLASGADRESAPSEPIRVRVPSRVLSSGLRSTSGDRFVITPGGESVIGRFDLNTGVTGLAAIDAETGRHLWTVPSGYRLVRRVADGRIVATDTEEDGSTRLVVLDPGGSVTRTVSLETVANGCALRAVDDAITQVIGVCSFRIQVWDAVSGRSIRFLEANAGSVASVSPAGDVVILSDGGRLQAYHLEQRRVIWSVPWCGSGSVEVSSAADLVLVRPCEAAAKLYSLQTGQAAPIGSAAAAVGFDDSGRYLYARTVSSRPGSSSVTTLFTTFDLGGRRLRSFQFDSFQSIDASALLVLPDDGLALLETQFPSMRLIRWAPGSRWEVVE